MKPKTGSRSTARRAAQSAIAAYCVRRGVPLPLGAWCQRGGVNFSIFSKHATSCTLVLLQPGDEQPFAEFILDPRSNRTGQVWHVFVEGLDAGVQYGYRFAMQPNPDPQAD